jgi:hypothetical protein
MIQCGPRQIVANESHAQGKSMTSGQGVCLPVRGINTFGQSPTVEGHEDRHMPH